MATEATFKRTVRNKIPRSVYVWPISARWQKGVPDWWVSGPTNDIWIEFKHLKSKTAPESIPIDLSPLQRDWIIKRLKEGRNVVVAIGCGKLAWILSTPEQISSTIIERRLLKTITVSDLARWISAFVGTHTDGGNITINHQDAP